MSLCSHSFKPSSPAATSELSCAGAPSRQCLSRHGLAELSYARISESPPTVLKFAAFPGRPSIETRRLRPRCSGSPSGSASRTTFTEEPRDSERRLDGSDGGGDGGDGGDSRGSGGGGGGGGEEEEELGPIMKLEEVMNEAEARGVKLPSDMIAAAKEIGIRRAFLLRYLDLQVIFISLTHSLTVFHSISQKKKKNCRSGFGFVSFHFNRLFFVFSCPNSF